MNRLSALTLGALLALAASGCWKGSPPEADKFRDYYCGEAGKPFFREDPSAKGTIVPGRKEASPFSFAAAKPAGVKRVFVVGESAAARLEGGERVLPASSGVEIINCGMGAYDSRRIRGVLEETLRYGPDLLVVLSGNNEGGEDPCPGTAAAWSRLKRRLAALYYAAAEGPLAAARKPSMRVQRAELLKMAAAARKAGVPAVFCTLPVNLEMPSEAPAPLDDPGFAGAFLSFTRRDLKKALEGFGALEGYYPAFFRARTLLAMGKRAEAREVFSAAASLDGLLTRSDPERNAMIAGAAAAGGACVADLEKLFARLSPGALPGFSQFEDGVHWEKEFGKAVWEEIFRSAEACGAAGFEKASSLRVGAFGSPAGKPALRRLSYAVSWINENDFSERALALLAHLAASSPALLAEASASPEKLGGRLIDNFWSGFGDPDTVRGIFPFFLAHLGEAARRSGDPRRALALFERALALRPDAGYAALGRALALADLGERKRAAAELFALADGGAAAGSSRLGYKARALAQAYGLARPELSEGAAAFAAEKADALSDEAVSLMRDGDLAGAEAALRKALRLRPEHPEALMTLCALRSRLNDRERALEACRAAAEAVYSDPGKWPPAYLELAAAADRETVRLLEELGRDLEAFAAKLRIRFRKAPAGG